MPARSMFLSTRILEVLAEQPPYLALSEKEILKQLLVGDRRTAFVESWIWDGSRNVPPPYTIPNLNLEDILELCLRDLARAELIVGEDLKEGGKRWRIVPRWPTRDGGGGDDGREPPLSRDGGGDGGSGGIGEVLAHPRLFALSDQDFEELLDHVTGTKQ